MVDYATHDDHHQAVVIGGGLLGLEAARGLQSHGIDVDVVHSGKHLMNAQLGREGGEVLRRSMASSASGSSPAPAPPRSGVPTRCAASGCGTRPRSPATWSWSPPASGRTPRWPSPVASPSSGRSWSTTRCGPSTTTTSTRWASACSTAARSTAWSRRCGSRPWCSPTTSPAPTRSAAYLGSRTATKLKVAGVEVASMGLTEPGARDRRAHRLLRAQQGNLQVDRDPRRQDHRRDAARRQPEGRLLAAGVRPRPAAAGGAGRADVRPRRSERGGRRRRTGRRRAGLQLQRGQQGPHRRHGEGRLSRPSPR